MTQRVEEIEVRDREEAPLNDRSEPSVIGKVQLERDEPKPEKEEGGSERIESLVDAGELEEEGIHIDPSIDLTSLDFGDTKDTETKGISEEAGVDDTSPSSMKYVVKDESGQPGGTRNARSKTGRGSREARQFGGSETDDELSGD